MSTVSELWVLMAWFDFVIFYFNGYGCCMMVHLFCGFTFGFIFVVCSLPAFPEQQRRIVRLLDSE